MTDVRPLSSLSGSELASLKETLEKDYAAHQGAGLKLDLTRGKPAPEQLDLSDGLLRLPTTTTDKAGTDTRNYGGLAGIPEIVEMFAELLRIEPAQLVAQGNSSLSLMRQTLQFLLLKGGVDSTAPWLSQGPIRFLCPVPGYDRHFALLEWLGIEMVPIPMTEHGPDAEAAAALAKDDPSIKGIWVVPTYSNPTGDTVTQEVADRLVSMPTAAPDFKILWDNAYALHHLTPAETKSADVLSLAAAAGNPHRPILFASTSKITYAGAGVAFLGGSKETIAWYLGHEGFGAIGPDKVNQLRHAEFFGSPQGVRDLMARHRDILAPKFAAVEEILEARLGGHEVATWTHPLGGYFVSLDVLPGTAARVIQLAKEAGVALTPAGSAFPHKQDPDDKNIRLAPSYPSIEDVRGATEVVATCTLLAAAEQLTKLG